ncbi:MAG: serine hydrolase domain-containing protein [Woeseia sp.]
MMKSSRLSTNIVVSLLVALSSMIIAAPQSEPGSKEGRMAYFEPEGRSIKFQRTDRIFPSRIVEAGSNTWILEKSDMAGEVEFRYEWDGTVYGVDDFNEQTNSNALLILKNGKIVTEIYRNGSTPASRFVSFSTAKSFTSTLVGMAYEDGYIDDVNDPLTKYLPSLTGSAYEGVTIRDALQMLSGIEWDEEAYDWADESILLVKHWNRSMVGHRYRFIEGANELKRANTPGAKYHYNTLETCILGWLVETVTKQRLSRYFEDRLWQPAGMEFDAAWGLDGPADIGREMSGGMLTATLRDYGRFGLMMANNGEANGKQLISPEWVRAATSADRDPIQYGNLYEEYPLGYGYQWWLFENGRFEAQGVYGQFVYVAPKDDVVIIKLSYWPDAWVDELESESYAFFDAVIDALK